MKILLCLFNVVVYNEHSRIYLTMLSILCFVVVHCNIEILGTGRG